MGLSSDNLFGGFGYNGQFGGTVMKGIGDIAAGKSLSETISNAAADYGVADNEYVKTAAGFADDLVPKGAFQRYGRSLQRALGLGEQQLNEVEEEAPEDRPPVKRRQVMTRPMKKRGKQGGRVPGVRKRREPNPEEEEEIDNANYGGKASYDYEES